MLQTLRMTQVIVDVALMAMGVDGMYIVPHSIMSVSL